MGIKSSAWRDVGKALGLVFAFIGFFIDLWQSVVHWDLSELAILINYPALSLTGLTLFLVGGTLAVFAGGGEQ
jgi:hypothetical protein